MDVSDITKNAVLISEEATLREAVEAMIKNPTNTLLVTGDQGVLVGEVSVSDLMDAVIPGNLNGDDVLELFANEDAFEEAVVGAEDKLVSEFMSTDFSPVTAHDSLITIAAQAVGFQRSRIPVVDDENRPIGIISRQGLKQILAKTLKINK
ncbi:CBS domain-containing protein [Candidatus Kaiserbacteria bacterium]|nr:CBS domain-containing protein [Candidatus Kaiserbacteria bacterium]